VAKWTKTAQGFSNSIRHPLCGGLDGLGIIDDVIAWATGLFINVATPSYVRINKEYKK
jgi:hypothetical protein